MLLLFYIILIVLLIGILFASNFLVSYSLDTKSNFFVSKQLKKSGQEIIEADYPENSMWLKQNTKTTTITSKDGLELTTNYTNCSSNKTAILIHGYGSKPEEAVRYAKHYFSLGYDCYLPNLRSHALSNGRFISMGYYESQDVLLWINYILKQNPNTQIVVHGVSMGAATTMLLNNVNLPDNVKLLIEDCGYTCVKDIFSDKLHNIFHLPSFPFIPVASLFSKMRAKFFFNNVNCIKAVHNAKLPMAFIHGKKDDFIPFFMLDTLYNACPTDKIRLEIDDATHAKSILQNPTLYWNTLDPFIQKYIK